MNRDDAMAYHPAGVGKMICDVEAFANDAALKGIDVTPLITASDFHAEISRRAISQSRARKARWHNRFAVALLMAASVLIGAIFYAASAKADTAADDWASVYGSAVCDTLDSYPTVSGLAGVLIGAQQAGGLTDEQAGEAVAVSVITRCPEYRGLLVEFVRRYGPVVA